MLKRMADLSSCLRHYSFLQGASDLALCQSLLVNGRAASITRYPDCLFHEAMWLPNSGGKHRLRLVEMEREAGKKKKRREREMLGKDPLSPCCSDLHPQCQEQYLACRYMMNICCTDEQNREKGLVVFLVSSCRRSHLLFTWAMNLRMQTGPAATAYWSLPTSLILRSGDHSFLTVCGLEEFQDFL